MYVYIHIKEIYIPTSGLRCIDKTYCGAFGAPPYLQGSTTRKASGLQRPPSHSGSRGRERGGCHGKRDSLLQRFGWDSGTGGAETPDSMPAAQLSRGAVGCES